VGKGHLDVPRLNQICSHPALKFIKGAKGHSQVIDQFTIDEVDLLPYVLSLKMEAGSHDENTSTVIADKNGGQRLAIAAIRKAMQTPAQKGCALRRVSQ
jgi:hypothetical protein